MNRVAWAVDIVNKKAGIPGTGNEPMTFTYTFDVAKFVIATLDLPKWDELMYCYGEKTTWNEFLKQAEEVTGKIIPRNCIYRLSTYVSFFEADEMLPHFIGSKFDVSYDPPEKLQKGEVTSLPSNEGTPDFPRQVLEGLMSFWGLYALEGKYDMPTDKAINKVFPDIQPLKVKDVLEIWRDQ